MQSFAKAPMKISWRIPPESFRETFKKQLSETLS